MSFWEGNKGAIIFYWEGRPSVCGGTRIFGVVKGGGPIFFSEPMGGGPEFFMRLRRNSFRNTLFKIFPRFRRNLSLYHGRYPITCSYTMFRYFLNPKPLALSFNYCPFDCLWQGNVLPLGGGPDVFHKSKGGDQNVFTNPKGRTKIFYVCKGGDQKKLATGNHKQKATASW